MAAKNWVVGRGLACRKVENWVVGRGLACRKVENIFRCANSEKSGDQNDSGQFSRKRQSNIAFAPKGHGC